MLLTITTTHRPALDAWETLPAGQFRHPDHRFEWTRQQFHDWAQAVAGRFGYTVRFLPVGPEHETLGSPTQMAIFHVANRQR